MKDETGTTVYTYDRNGYILKVTDSNGNIRRSYDALNRVTQYTDYYGNTIKYTQVTGRDLEELKNMEMSYDCRNRLARATGITYTYDAENQRIRAESDEWIETYVTDTNTEVCLAARA